MLKHLAARSTAWNTNWLAELPWVMLALCAAANLETGVYPSLLVTGQQPALPSQLVVERSNIDNASSFGRELSSAMANQHFVENPWHDKKSRARVPDDLWTAKRVLVRADKVQPSLAPKYTVPTVYYTDGGGVFGYSWTTIQTRCLLTDFVLFMRMRRFGQHQTRLSTVVLMTMCCRL